MVRPVQGIRPQPVFLYNDPHPVHEKMAERIDAEFVECSKDGALGRLRSGLGREFRGRPVLIEGGVPLFETAFMSLFRRCGPVIELAADATLIDIATPLEGRPARERLAHRFGEQFVDATITVSDYIAAYARSYDRPVEVVHPFVEAERYEKLSALEPGGDDETLLCVGKYRNKNGQDILRDAMAQVDGRTAHFVGPDTEKIDDSVAGVEAHGFVDLDKFYDLFDRADLMIYPARVGAYPVAVLEALVAETPVVTTPYVGNVDLVRSIDPGFVTDPDPRKLVDTITWAIDRDIVADGRRCRAIGQGFKETSHLREFENRFNKVLSKITVE
jgi:glycosyltransferase involved in cell wall biosynthesis